MVRMISKYGKIVRFYYFTEPTLLVADYKMLEFFLSSTKFINKALAYQFLHNWLGTGLLTSSDTKWKKHRRMITPAYHFSILEQFVPIFDSTCDTFIEILKEKCTNHNKAEIDVYPLVTLLTLDIICGK